MSGALIIFGLTMLMYIPLAGLLLFVWWKHGKGEKGVVFACSIFLLGSIALLLYMLTL